MTGREKRPYESTGRDGPQEKRPRAPALASVVVEAVRMDMLHKLCSSLEGALEPMLRRVVSEEVERALSRLAPSLQNGRSPGCLEGPQARELRLAFKTKLALPLFTGSKVEGKQGVSLLVVLQDENGKVVTSGPEANCKLDVVALEGDFNADDDEDWSQEEFERNIVKERDGRRPILHGDLTVTLKDGVGSLGEITFTDNSSWNRSRKFRLGVRVAQGYVEAVRIREAKTEAFNVKDHRGELYKKHYPPTLNDKVWRLDKIGKDGKFHQRLNESGIENVQDFLRLVVTNPQKLRHILGSGMSNSMWKNTVEHAMTCVLNGKLYVYSAPERADMGVLFNNIYQLMGLIADGEYVPVDAITDADKVYVDKLVQIAYDNWHQVVEYEGSDLLGSQKPYTLCDISDVSEEADGSAGARMPSGSGITSQNGTSSGRLTPPTGPSSPLDQGLSGHGTSSYLPFPPPQPHPALTRNQLGIQHYQGARPPSRPRHTMQGTMWHPASTPQLPQLPSTVPVSNGALTPLHDGRNRMVGVNGNGNNFLAASPMMNFNIEEWPTEDELRNGSREILADEDMESQLTQFFRMYGVPNGEFPGAVGSSNPSTPELFPLDPGFFPQEGSTDMMPFVPTAARGQRNGRSTGWLKLKAALLWGIFVRKRAAAKRRARIEEIND
eukprot:TRINITY_DN12223_c0_g1_i1.p1 TRINITY_DN12223_c0_g1~~TRINITY_DN12223_c0_g1_i1.p1  ORF type:complete len:666 (+),score=128.70 TRINITY_DN12223_c0_g1_i1:288-2285(+)